LALWSVVPAVYYAVNNHELTNKSPKLNQTTQNVMDEVLGFYGEKAPFLLVKLTHQEGTPCQNVYIDGMHNIKIPKQAIVDYYTEFLNKTKKQLKQLQHLSFVL